MTGISRRALGTVAVVAMTLTTLGATAADAARPAQFKPFVLSVGPDPIVSPRSGQTVAASATFTNTTATQLLGSANLAVPAPFGVAGASVASPATVTVSGSQVGLRNANLPPGGSITVSLELTTPSPCSYGAAGSIVWSAAAKQSNDFNGAGNDLTLDRARSALSPELRSQCAVVFLNQPGSAVAGQIVTTTEFDTPQGAPITAALKDQFGAGVLVTDFAASVTVGIGPWPAGGTASGTTTRALVGGTASFDDISVSPGNVDYELLGTSPGQRAGLSEPFNVWDTNAVCVEDNDCPNGLATNRTRGELTAFSNAESGNLSMSVNPAPGLLRPKPGGGFEPCGTSDTYAFFATTTERTKKAVYTTISAGPKFSRSAVANQQICYGADYVFAVVGGGSAPQSDKDGDGALDTWFVGHLADCVKPPPYAHPCVSGRGGSGQTEMWIEISIPGGLQDPSFRG